MADGRVVIEAVLDTANVSKNVKSMGRELQGVSWSNITAGDEKAKALAGSFKAAGSACTVGLTAPIAAAGAAAFGVAANYEQAAGRIQSALGVTSEEAERLKDVGAGIYEDGWGDSLDQVTEAVIAVRQNIGELNDADLSAVTQGALVLQDTLGMDMNETIRGASALVKGFGMDGKEAMDYITAAAQGGLDISGELGDNLAEYATLFQENGYSASEMFSVLEAGLDAGAYNLDKVNDLVKEFGVRMSDGSVAAACEQLGGNFKAMFDQMSASGASNSDIFQALAGEVANLGTEQEKAAAISAIFGSQGEDNGIKVVEAMGRAAGAYGDVAGAADAAADAAGGSFAAKMESAGRTVMGALEPLGQPLLDIAENVAGMVQSFGEWFSGIGEGGQMAVLAVGGLLAALGPVLSLVGSLVTVVPAIAAAFSGIAGAVTAAGGALPALGGALSALAGPVGIVVAVVAGLVAAFVYLWNTNEGFRTSVTEAWNAICGTVQGIVDQLRPYIEEAWAAISNAVTQAMNVIMPIVSAGFQFVFDVAVPILQQLLQNVGNVFQVILSTVTGVMGGIGQIIQGAWTLVQGIFQTVLGLINGIVTGDFSQMQAGIEGIMSGITGIISGAWNAITSVVSGAINGVVTFIEGGLNTALSVVEGIFSGIQGAIEGAMNGAESVVSGVIDAIKGFFDFRISWPHIPLPHINYELIEVPLLGSIPNPATLSISWYAKGGVFNGPSVIGVGEAGTEGVVPFNKRGARPLAEGIADELAGMPRAAAGGGVTVNVSIGEFVNRSADDMDALVERVARDIQRKVGRSGRARGLA